MNNIQLSLFSNKINAICEEMGEVLRFSSFSPNIKDRLDFSCAIFDASGELCAQAAHIPVHLGSMAYAMKDVVNSIDWSDGDMLVFNDPFKGGTHLPDVTLVAPIFINHQLCAFVTNRAHHADIGADSAGSMPLSSSIDEEGLLISPKKIVVQHEINKKEFKAITNKMSCKQTSHGDFTAQISANQTGLKRLKPIIKTLQVEPFIQALKALNNYAERIALQTIKNIPHGQYSFSDFLEDDGFGHKMLEISSTISILDDQVIVDFEGSSRQTQGNINCPLSVAAAAVYYVFRCLMPSNTPACSGSFRRIQIKAPSDCILNAKYPAAVAAGNVETSSRIVDTILGALQKALPEQIPAASYGTMNNVAMGNSSNTLAHSNSDLNTMIMKDIKPWSYYETIGGGFGAHAKSNGISATQAHMTNTLNTPIESIESHYPLRISKYSIHKKTNHKRHSGINNGGDGIIRCFTFLDTTDVTLLTERRVIPPWGINGADDGQVGFNELDTKSLAAKTQFYASAGQELCIKTPCGGSWKK